MSRKSGIASCHCPTIIHLANGLTSSIGIQFTMCLCLRVIYYNLAQYVALHGITQAKSKYLCLNNEINNQYLRIS